MAATLLDVESGGGQMIYGRPPGPCGQPHKSVVTEENYRVYLAQRATCGTQGVGAMQLTWGPLQDLADQRGGCWVPAVNVAVGLGEFVTHLQGHSIPEALSLYNTGKPGPSPYALRALERLPRWQQVITP